MDVNETPYSLLGIYVKNILAFYVRVPKDSLVVQEDFLKSISENLKHLENKGSDRGSW